MESEEKKSKFGTKKTFFGTNKLVDASARSIVSWKIQKIIWSFVGFEKWLDFFFFIQKVYEAGFVIST